MLPPDIMAAMGGGGGGGAMPPDIAALMGGGGGAPPMAPEEEGPPSIVEGEPGGGEDSLVIALDALQDAIDAEADQEDIQVMLQCQAKLQGVLAKNQKDADAAMGGKVTPGAMRKQASAAMGGGAY